MFSRRLLFLLPHLRELSAARLAIAVFVGLLVLPEQPASPVLAATFTPLGIALWYLVLGQLDSLQAAVTEPAVRRGAHIAVGVAALWTLSLVELSQFLFVCGAAAALVYAVAARVERRLVAKRML